MNNLQLSTFRKLWILALSLALGLYGLPVRAADAGPFSADTSVSADEWLEHLEVALEQTSYRGVFIYARGAEVNAMGIVHRYQGGQVRERLSQLDGGNGEIIRNGDEVVCILPDRGRLELDAIIPAGPFAGAFSDRLKPMSHWYNPHILESGRIAGYDAVVIAVTAKDAHRYSYRLWLERETGLLLKSQVRDGQGQVLERFQFTQLEITNGITDAELEVAASGRKVLQGLKAVPHTAAGDSSLTEPKASATPRAWQLEWTPDGFVAFTEKEAEHHRLIAFSDGMASFSVFVEPKREMDMPVGASLIGATTAYLHKISAGDQVYLVTVVGEIPPATAMRVAQSVTFDEAQGSPEKRARPTIDQ